MEGGFSQSENITFRAAKEHDLQIVAKIFNENIVQGDATLWEKTFTASGLSEEIRNYKDREAMYVLVLQTKVIGFGTIRLYHPKRGYSHTCETSVFLDRDYIGRGHGSKFKRFILEECRRLDYHHVVAKILASNERSIEYNLKLGYSMVGIQKEVGKKGDQLVDVVILQYLIPR